MKRYRLETLAHTTEYGSPYYSTEMVERSDGGWCDYEDVKFELIIKNREIHNLKRHIEDYCPSKDEEAYWL